MDKPNRSPRIPTTLDPLTAAGGLLFLISLTALLTYSAIILPGRLRAAQGPPEEFLLAATRQQEALSATGAASPSPKPTTGTAEPTPIAEVILDGGSLRTPFPTPNRYGDWPLPDNMPMQYWLSIPQINLEAPIVALGTRQREVDGVAVQRLLVPNAFAVGWDVRSVEPGLGGNTILVGHNNLYGGVFSKVHTLGYGAEISVWSDRGVFSYFISEIQYIPEDGEPLSTRLANARWLQATSDNRLTLITCWPLEQSTHRLIVVATR